MKPTKVFVPVSVEERFPDKHDWYFVKENIQGTSYPEGIQYDPEYKEFLHDRNVTHWLEEREGYFLTKEELEKLLRTTWQDGNTTGRVINAPSEAHKEWENNYIKPLIDNP